MTTWDLVAGLPVTIEGYGLDLMEQKVSSDFDRKSTVITIHGGGQIGVGEDVTYDAVDHDVQQKTGPVHELAGVWTLGDFCDRVDELDLFAQEPVRSVSRLYRRWAFHSAALDLALRQAGRPLHAVLGREPRPVTFVVSIRLGEPASLDPVRTRLGRYPTLRFKLDPTASWTDDVIAALVETGAVDSVDFKGLYTGTVVDNPADPDLYRRVVEAFPNAWIEDPALTDETSRVLAAHHDRITWDAPIHGVADIRDRPFPPRMVNIKPSRLGGLRRLLDAYDYCAAEAIGCYGGGQFELGPGRGQNQYLASMFHPDTPNDIAPTGYNLPDPADGLQSSPLAPVPAPIGFRWGPPPG
jgi:L-alanine-DL-glutamate epimerase-like enolase superfamily enzyme